MNKPKLNLDKIHDKILTSDKWLNADTETQINILKVFLKAETCRTLKDFYLFGNMLQEEELNGIPFCGEITEEIIKQNRFLNIAEHWDNAASDYCYIDLRELPPPFTSIHDLENWKLNVCAETLVDISYYQTEYDDEIITAIGWALVDREKEKNYKAKNEKQIQSKQKG